MIDISQYRCRIGSFCQQIRKQKFIKYENECRYSQQAGRVTFTTLKSILMVASLFVLLTTSAPAPPSSPLPCSTSAAASWATPPSLLSLWMVPTIANLQEFSSKESQAKNKSSFRKFHHAELSPEFHILGKKQSVNFLAKYVNGNRKKGVLNLHLNIRSLSRKVGEIKKLIKEHSPHVLGLSECELKKVNNQYDEAKLKIPGYNVLFPKSWNHLGYARVLVYVKKSLEFEQVHELEDEKVQSIWLRAGFKNAKKIYMCHGYREHLGNNMSAQRSNLELFLSQWEMASEHSTPAEPNEVHVACDMNLDCLNGKWLEPGYHLLTLSRMVQNICNAYNFTQLVKEPTRLQYNSIQNKTDISCIDHVYTNTEYRCSGVTVTSFGDSDHDMVGYTRFSKEPPAPARTIRKRSYKSFDKEKYLSDLAQVDWSDVLCCEDLDEATETLTRKLRYILNIHAPWVIFQQRKFFIPWLTNETKQLMADRDRYKEVAKNLALRDQGRGVSEEQKSAWNVFRKFRNRVTNSKRNDENKYKSRKITEDQESPDKVWKTAKSFMGWKTTGSPSQLEVDGKLETKPSRLANLMNDFFIDKVVTIRNGLKKVPECVRECWKIMEGKDCSLSLRHVTVDKVCKLIKKLKGSKSTSVDELDSYAVKIAADILAKPLHHIITLSLMQKKFPSGWKYTKLIPLHKKLCTLERKNYRPVAILSPLSKILEKVVYLQLYEYLSTNKLFHPNLHGYRKHRSTQTALLQMYDRWVRAAAAGKVSGVILIDLSAAFDLVDSNLLLKKLKIYGLDNDLLMWIESYLTERQQAVWIDHTYSEFRSHSIGVPQGSNLGPLFFLIYYSDLLYTLDCPVDAYADDSTMTTSGTIAEISSKLTENCDKIVNWMCSNHFKLNADKTHILTVGTRERLSTLSDKVMVTMDGVQLVEGKEKCELLLGCEMEANLKWDAQTSLVLSKLRTRLVGLTSLKYVVPYPTLNTITTGMFNSVLVYCLPLYGGCNVSQLKSLQVMQNKAARVVSHLPPRTSREFLYNRIKWLTVNQLVAYHTLITVFKIRETGEPEYLAQFLKYDNRQDRIIIPNTDLGLAKKSFVWRGSLLWNSMSLGLRKCTKIGQFKTGIKQWVLDNIPRFLE